MIKCVYNVAKVQKTFVFRLNAGIFMFFKGWLFYFLVKINVCM